MKLTIVLLSLQTLIFGLERPSYSEISINHKQVDLAFDSGSSFPIILFKGYALKRGLKISTANTSLIKQETEGLVTYKDNTFRKKMPVFTPPSGSESSHIKGVVGWPVIKNTIAQIKDGQIVELDSLPDTSGWTICKIVEAPVLVIESAGMNIFIDTGSLTGIHLPSKKWDGLKKTGVTLSLYFSARRKYFREFQTILPVYNLGDLILNNIMINKNESDEEYLEKAVGKKIDAIIGFEALQKFDVIITKKNLYLKKIKNKKLKSYPEFNRYGAIFIPDETGQLRAEVVPSSPAEESGLENGDIFITSRERSNTLKINKLWRQPKGTEVKFTVKRETNGGSKLIEINFKLNCNFINFGNSTEEPVNK